MEKPDELELLDKVVDKYQLAVIAAKRARLLNLGSPKKVDIPAKKLTTIAVCETLLGKVKHKISKDKKHEK